MMFTIEEFKESDQSNTKAFVLSIQNEEFGLGFSDNEQPDLLNIGKFYRNGNFWLAKYDEEIVGTIGLQILDSTNAVLRKMFVKQNYRGKQKGIAHSLFDTLKTFAMSKDINLIWLDTPGCAKASHRFYEKIGFIKTERMYLPKSYTFPDRESLIYRLSIDYEFKKDITNEKV